MQVYQPTRDAAGSQLAALRQVGAVLHDAPLLQPEGAAGSACGAALAASARLQVNLLRLEHRALVGGTEFACGVVHACAAGGGETLAAGALAAAYLI